MLISGSSIAETPISSEEFFGAVASSIASAEAFGTALLTINVGGIVGIPSEEAFGDKTGIGAFDSTIFEVFFVPRFRGITFVLKPNEDFE